MNETRLREALTELADSVPAVDLVPGRWREGVRRRRRTGLVTGLASAAAVAAVVTVVSLPDGGPGSVPTAPAMTSSTPATEVTPDGPDATVAGHPAYLSPDLADEAVVPWYEGDLPKSVSLATGSGDPDHPDHAIYAFATAGSGFRLLVGLVTRDGQVDPLRVPEEYGMALDVNGTLPFTANSLAPDGRRLALVTKDGFAVYELATRAWQEFGGPGSLEERETFSWGTATNVWVGDTFLDVVNGNVGRCECPDRPGPGDAGFPIGDWWGPERRSPAEQLVARAGFATEITELDGGVLNPEVVAVGGSHPALLVINGGGERFKGCCAVAGWLDDEWVVYESRSVGLLRLMAWNVTDGQFRRVAEIPTGATEGGAVGSYADLAWRD